MAEALANEIIKRYDCENKIKVTSAGLHAIPGDPPSRHALDVLAEEGIVPSEHKAVQLTELLLEKADLVLTMTSSQKNYLLNLFPEAEKKVHVLKEFLEQKTSDSLQNKQDDYDITDPFMQPRQVYETCFQELRQIIDELFRKIAEEDFKL